MTYDRGSGAYEMSDESGYYSVIQYCPDRGREEAANVGVLLYMPSSQLVQAKVGPLSERARKFFRLRTTDASRPNAAAESLAHLVNAGLAYIDSVEALAAFVATRANDIRVTAPRLVAVSNFVRDLETLYDELVEAAQLQTTVEKLTERANIPPALYSVFAKLAGEGRVQSELRIRIPVLERELEIPYAYRNGVLNLVKPEVFLPRKSSENRTIRLGAEGQLLEKHPEAGQRKLIVVAGPGSTTDGEVRAARLLNELGVRFVRQDQAVAFAEEVDQQAH
jgi:hypothetical protein